MALRRFVLDPHAFFESRRENPSLLHPGLIVLANAISSTALLLFLFWAFSGIFSAAARKVLVYAISGQTVSAPRQFVFAAVASFGMYFVVWLLVAGFISAVGRYHDTGGSTRGVLALVGWSQLPVLLGNLATTVVLFVLIGGAPPLGSEQAVETWVKTSLRVDPVYRVTRGVQPLLTVWAVYCWVLAGMYGRNLSRRQALVSVAIPGLVAIGKGLVTYYFLFS